MNMREPKGKMNRQKSGYLQEIEGLRTELNLKAAQGDNEINSEETLKLSQRLDDLIVKHLMDEIETLHEELQPKKRPCCVHEK